MPASDRPRDGGVSADGGVPTDGETARSAATTAENHPVWTETVTFESQGVQCEADLYLPAAGDPPWPTVVMAHVFGAARTWGLAAFAERFARAGFAAFVFDYRHLGGSDGTPRRLVDSARQLDDWEAALAHVRSREEVDDERIALWGSSFSGGHALATARQESEVRAVVAQVPFVDGRATVAHQISGRGLLERGRTMGLALADWLAAAVGRGPVCIPTVSEPGDGGLVDSPGAKTGFLSLVPEGEEPINRTPARVVLDQPFYRPIRHAGEVDVPVHVVVAEEDRLLPHGPTERLLDRLADPSVHRVPSDHFGVHREPVVRPVVDEQVAFLSDVLGVGD